MAETAEELKQALDAGFFRDSSIDISEQVVQVEIGSGIAPACTVEDGLQENERVGSRESGIVPRNAVLRVYRGGVVDTSDIYEAHPIETVLLQGRVVVERIKKTLAVFTESGIGHDDRLADGVGSRRVFIALSAQICGVFDHKGSHDDENDEIAEHADRVDDDKLILLPDDACA